MNKNVLAVCLFSFFLILFSNCDNKRKVIFEKNYDIKNTTWTYADTLDFDFEIPDTNQVYDLVLMIKHRSDYNMQNIYTNIYTKFPQGERVKQVLSLDLADNFGVWQGKCSGNSCAAEIVIQENAFFRQAGKYVITLEQFTRLENLTGIEKVGLKVINTGKSLTDVKTEKQQKKK